MNKTILSLAIAGLLAFAASASVTFNGTALVQTSGSLGFTNGQIGIYLNKNDSTSLWASLAQSNSIGAGLSLFSSATYTPLTAPTESYTFLTNVTAGASSLSGGMSGLSYSGGFSAGDEFAVLIFSNSTSTTIAGDTFRIFRGTQAQSSGGWVMPADGLTLTYNTNPVAGSSVQQIRSTSFLVGSGTVAIPEPSTYALLAMSGAAVAGYVVRRRRRA